jgi:gliding motility-associated-like protein
VTVNPLPVVNAGTNQTVCEGSGVVTLAGSPAGGTFTGTGMTGNNFDPAAGTQTITYDYTDGNGCSNSDQVTITVEPTPVVSAGNYGPVCMNDADVVLVGSPAGGTFSGTGVSGNTFDPSSGTQTITYDYTSPAGCSNSANTVITVNPLPLGGAGSYADVCIDAPDVALIGNPVGGVFSGTGVTGNSFNPSSGTQTITYTFTDGNGCENTSTTTINVNDLPTIGAGADLTICEGDQITLSGTGGVAYDWSNGVFNGQPFTPTLGQTDYTVTGTDANGCTNTDVVTITTVPVPVSDVTASIESGLPSLEVDFYNNSDMATSYFWNFGDGTTGTTTDLSTQNNTFTEPGTYWVVLTASNGICSDYDTVQIIVIEHPAPIINIPNVFTPNGDNSNDVFFIDAQNVVSIQYIIVNRWNNLMFEGSGINPVWDGTSPNGTPAADGVYFVKYEIVGINDDVINGHGHVTLVR